MPMKTDPFPILSCCLGALFLLSGIGIFSVCRALAHRIRYGKAPLRDI